MKKIRIKGGTVVNIVITAISLGIGLVEKSMEKKRVNAEIAKQVSKEVAKKLTEEVKGS